MKVVKRNNSLIDFDREKINSAIFRSMKNGSGIIRPDIAEKISIEIEQEYIDAREDEISIYDIEEKVFNKLIKENQEATARAYEGYRAVQEYKRHRTILDDSIEQIVNGTNVDVLEENSNKAAEIAPTQRDLIAGEYSKDYSRRALLPNDILTAHDEGIIHFHDMDYFISHVANCCLINLDDMLQNGTMISEAMIETPKSFQTACTVTSQIVAQVASNQYGGQTWSLAHLAPFVDVSRKKIRQKVIYEMTEAGFSIDCEQIEKVVEMRLSDEIKSGIQTVTYQLYTLLTTNGQTPFVSIFMYINEAPEGRERDDLILLIKEVLEQRILGIKNEKGVYVTPAFPKLLYVLQEDNVEENTKYWWLTQLAARCTAKRLVPDYISEKIAKQLKGDVYPCMGCRSFLTPDRFTEKNGNVANASNYDGKHKYYGRFNQGVVTLNLVDVALSSYGNIDKFWELMNMRLDLCHRALRLRHERLLGTTTDIAPIMWRHGALARLKPGETIDKLLYGGYSTLSLGYAGLAECVKYMTTYSHTEPKGKEFGIAVMEALNGACAKWKAEENIDYSVYGTPLESTTYRLAKCLKKRFGSIKNITDHNYITNSYHVCVRDHIDAFSKLTKEAEFQKLSPGGAISYVETPNLQDNVSVIYGLIKHIYNTILYAELNTKSDYCSECGYDGEIIIEEEAETGRLYWKCPCCGNTDQKKLNVARRTCGYIGSQFWNQGRTEEIRDRVLHVGGD